MSAGSRTGGIRSSGVVTAAGCFSIDSGGAPASAGRPREQPVETAIGQRRSSAKTLNRRMASPTSVDDTACSTAVETRLSQNGGSDPDGSHAAAVRRRTDILPVMAFAPEYVRYVLNENFEDA